MMEYKGYIGHVEFDYEAEIFHGNVINTCDIVTFQRTTVEEIKQAFRDSVACIGVSSVCVMYGRVL